MANPIIEVECINKDSELFGTTVLGQLRPAIVAKTIDGRAIYELQFCILIKDVTHRHFNEWLIVSRQDWRTVNAKRPQTQDKSRSVRTSNGNMENERSTSRQTNKSSKFNRTKPQ